MLVSGPVGAIAPAPGRLFVGRERELEELSTALLDARDGRGRLFLLVGEPGIGKTRLADELAQRAVAGGARVLWGRCWESGGAPAYWPWTQVLRTYLRETPADVAMAQMGPGVRDFAQLSPWLREHLGAASGEGPEPGRFGVFDSLTSFLQAAAAAQPLVLILDDLHAADEASLRLLQFVARELRGAPLLVVGTYRDADLRRAPSLLPIVADLAREGQRLPLRGLSSAEVGRFVTSVAASPRDDLVAAIHKATGGNPFFVTEVVRLWVTDVAQRQIDPESAAFQVPDEVRDAIRRRLAPLSSDASTMLSLAAVVGREFDATLVERVANLGVAAGDALAEAEDAGLIQGIAREGRYAFAHALVRQTLYGDLRPSRRVALHRNVAEALESQSRDDPEPHLADLAHHYYHAAAAGVADQAVLYTTRAAEQAVRQLAYEEAAMQYERALHALQLGPSQPADVGRAALVRAELLLALGDAQRSSGTQALWRPTYRRAAAAARAALGTSHAGAAARLLTRAALAVGRSSETGNVDEELLGLVQEALAALGDGDPVSRARLLARYSMALYFSPDSVGGEALSREALALAQETGDAPTVVRCLVALHFALWRPDHLDERERVAAQLVQLAEQAREHEMAIEGHLWFLVDELERGDGVAAAREMDAVARAASALRHPLYRWHAELHRAMRALAEGRVDDAEQISGAALQFGERAGLQNPRQAFGVQTFWIRREQGRLAELEEQLQTLAERFRIPIWRCGLALLHAETGRVDEARRALGPLVENDIAALRVDGNWLPGMATLAQACAEVGDRERGRRIYDRLLPYADRVVVIAQAHVCLGPVAYFLGLLAALDERWDDAVAHFEAARAHRPGARRDAARGVRPVRARVGPARPRAGLGADHGGRGARLRTRSRSSDWRASRRRPRDSGRRTSAIRRPRRGSQPRRRPRSSATTATTGPSPSRARSRGSSTAVGCRTWPSSCATPIASSVRSTSPPGFVPMPAPVRTPAAMRGRSSTTRRRPPIASAWRSSAPRSRTRRRSTIYAGPSGRVKRWTC